MTELAQYLESMEPDMMNVTRLFGIADAAWEDPRRFSWSAWEEGGSYHCRVSGDGREAEGSAAIPMDGDAQLRALHRKRAARRLCSSAAADGTHLGGFRAMCRYWTEKRRCIGKCARRCRW